MEHSEHEHNEYVVVTLHCVSNVAFCTIACLLFCLHRFLSAFQFREFGDDTFKVNVVCEVIFNSQNR